jgi:hypothetical protein
MPGVRSRWVNHIYNILSSSRRGLGVNEIRGTLFNKMRDPPSARQITSNLKIDKRFTVLGKTVAGSLLRAKSHEVTVFGLSERTYDLIEPFRQR